MYMNICKNIEGHSLLYDFRSFTHLEYQSKINSYFLKEIVNC